jgi:hypothetical protein
MATNHLLQLRRHLYPHLAILLGLRLRSCVCTRAIAEPIAISRAVRSGRGGRHRLWSLWAREVHKRLVDAEVGREGESALVRNSGLRHLTSDGSRVGNAWAHGRRVEDNCWL